MKEQEREKQRQADPGKKKRRKEKKGIETKAGIKVVDKKSVRVSYRDFCRW